VILIGTGPWTVAGALKTRKVFTLGRADFSTYCFRRGHASESFEIVG